MRDNLIPTIFSEPTFLIDKVPRTYESVMKLMFDETSLIKRAGIYYVLDGRTKMKRLKNNQVMYHSYWRGMHNRSFNVIWKPKGGGKRDSQILFLKLIHLGIITKPRDAVLYVDADTSFTPLDFGRLYNGLMKDEKAGAACGEIKVRNMNYRNLYTLAQSYEYLVSHMLTKAAESWHGIVRATISGHQQNLLIESSLTIGAVLSWCMVHVSSRGTRSSATKVLREAQNYPRIPPT